MEHPPGPGANIRAPFLHKTGHPEHIRPHQVDLLARLSKSPSDRNPKEKPQSQLPNHPGSVPSLLHTPLAIPLLHRADGKCLRPHPSKVEIQ